MHVYTPKNQSYPRGSKVKQVTAMCSSVIAQTKSIKRLLQVIQANIALRTARFLIRAAPLMWTLFLTVPQEKAK